MGSFNHTYFLVIFLLGLSITWGTSDEDPAPLRITKNFYPKKYLQMDLGKFRVAPTEEPTTTSSTVTEKKNEESTTEQMVETTTMDPELEDLTSSEEQIVKEIIRTRKSAGTTFCVEIRPSNPYQKPFKVCDSENDGDDKPNSDYGGNNYGNSGGYGKTYEPHPQSGYGQPQPGYGQPHLGYGPLQPSYAPPQFQHSYATGYERPVMVVPHVPVAEPYHVPKPAYRPPGGKIYRSRFSATGNGNFEEGIRPNMEERTAYYDKEDSYDDKSTIYDSHKKKEINYLPVVTHSYTKTKPMKMMKLLKDLKKDKYKIYEEEHHSSYDHHEPSHKEGSSSHGLVITCQPSAVGYTGSQSQLELLKQMELLKNLYAQNEKLYGQPLKSNFPSQMGPSGGYVAPETYRSSEGWKLFNAEEDMRSPEGWKGAEAEESMRSSAGWKATAPEENMRTPEDWKVEPHGRASKGEKYLQEQVRMSPSSSAEKYLQEQVRMSPNSSANPSPTVGMSQKDFETTQAFKENQRKFKIQNNKQ